MSYKFNTQFFFFIIGFIDSFLLTFTCLFVLKNKNLLSHSSEDLKSKIKVLTKLFPSAGCE